MRSTARALTLLGALLSIAGCAARGARAGTALSDVDPAPVDAPRQGGTFQDAGDDRDVESAPREPFQVPSRLELEGAHRLEIVRDYRTDEEAALIDRAEQLCPEQESIRRALLLTSPAAVPGPEVRCLWWQGVTTDGGTRIPWAVTGDALAYFVDAVEGARRAEAAGSSDRASRSSQLTYHASLEVQDLFASQGRTYRDVRTVRLELSFTQFGWGTTAFGLSLVRQVLFPLDEERPPVVLGDGEVALWGAPLLSAEPGNP